MMAKEQRPIDANDVKMREKLMMIVCDRLEDGCVGHCNFPHCYRVNNVADQLIANDVVPVVRCKDCKHWERWETTCGVADKGYCKCHEVDAMEADDFCSYGEKRGNNG